MSALLESAYLQLRQWVQQFRLRAEDLVAKLDKLGKRAATNS